MNNISKHKLILIKKIIGFTSCIICLILMNVDFINYISSSSLNSGGAITMTDSFSLFDFLFNKESVVLDSKIIFLRDIFKFSYLIVWISFVLILFSIIAGIIGLIEKKALFSKISNFILLFGIILLSFMFFNKYSSGNTIKFLNVFNLEYALTLIISSIGLYSSITIYEMKRR